MKAGDDGETDCYELNSIHMWCTCWKRAPSISPQVALSPRWNEITITGGNCQLRIRGNSNFYFNQGMEYYITILCRDGRYLVPVDRSITPRGSEEAGSWEPRRSIKLPRSTRRTMLAMRPIDDSSSDSPGPYRGWRLMEEYASAHYSQLCRRLHMEGLLGRIVMMMTFFDRCSRLG